MYDHVADVRGKFDWVIANPPFGIRWATASAEENCVSGATCSEHWFLEVALQALKPGGHAAFIAPPTFLTGGNTGGPGFCHGP
jgi:tRNA1(Val) A37 N6-methylase TrmN6